MAKSILLKTRFIALTPKRYNIAKSHAKHTIFFTKSHA
jgi:hypothetical protein